MEKVSVIMPVYNKEAYLGEAIESVLKQTYQAFELLLIDDGSTDGSREICEQYSQKDSRILFLENNTQHHGPGPARNMGLECATGEYLYFMDADDWIDERLLECTVARMRETTADIAMVGIKTEQEDGEIVSPYVWGGRRLLEKKDIAEDIAKCWDFIKTFWLHLYRHETVKNIRFENIINGEDLCYFADCLSVAQTIAFTDKVYYHYRYVAGSTSRRWNKNMIDCQGDMWEHQRHFLDSLPGQVDPSFYAVVAYERVTRALYDMGTILCPLSFREKQNVISALENRMNFDRYRGLYPLKLQHGYWRLIIMIVMYRLEGLIILFGPAWCKMKGIVQVLKGKNRKVE